MSYFSQNIQYPINCPACLRNTALNLSQLLDQTTIDCRHCHTPITIERRIHSAMKRTMNELDTYVSTTATSGKKPVITDDHTDSSDSKNT